MCDPKLTPEEASVLCAPVGTFGKRGQRYVTESTLQEMEDAADDFFKPIEEFESGVGNIVQDFVFSIKVAVTLILVLIVVMVGFKIYGQIAKCFHAKKVQRMAKAIVEQTTV